MTIFLVLGKLTHVYTLYTYMSEERTPNAANAGVHQRLPSGKNDGKGHNRLH